MLYKVTLTPDELTILCGKIISVYKLFTSF